MQSKLQQNPGQLTLEQHPLTEHYSTADGFVEALGRFWNAPATSGRCTDLSIPGFSTDPSGSFFSAPEQKKQLSQPVASTLQRLSAVTALSIGNSKWAYVPTAPSIVRQVLELLPNLQSLTSIQADKSRGRHLMQTFTSDNEGSEEDDPELYKHEEVSQLAAQIFKLPLQELSISEEFVKDRPCTALCPHLKQTTALTKLQLPAISVPECLPYSGAIWRLTTLQVLTCTWELHGSEEPVEALCGLMDNSQSLTALHTLDLGLRSLEYWREVDCSSELEQLSCRLPLLRFPQLRNFRYTSPHAQTTKAVYQNAANTAEWLASLSTLINLDVRGPVHPELKNGVDSWCDAERSRRCVSGLLLLPLLPKLNNVQVVNHFEASLADYGPPPIAHTFEELHTALAGPD